MIGNPPYVRQELIPRRNDKPKPKPMQAKEDLLELCADLWPSLELMSAARPGFKASKTAQSIDIS